MLIAEVRGVYHTRCKGEVADLLAAAYGTERDEEQLARRLPMIRAALQEGDIVRATILAVQARIGPLSTDGLAKLAKYNFKPDEPRDWHGRWTDSGNAAPEPNRNNSDHPALLPVQELLPFGARPPLFFDEPPETLRPFKEAIPRLSGKEGAKDIPSWARGKRPYVGENGRDYAKRLMDKQYGRGNWKTSDKEYRRLRKYGDRSFRDPRSIFLLEEEQI